MHTVVRVGECDVIVKPSPVAMAWNEPGRPHEALAAPGVRLATGESLVEVELATICGSDVLTVRGQRAAPTPLVLGHEAVGRVVAVGEAAARADGTPLELGDRVVWSVGASCGTCDRCRRGLSQACRAIARYGHERVHRGWELSGAFATHVQLRAGTVVVRVSEQLPASVAATASCATATAVAALDAASARVPLDGALVLVTGAGMLGLSVTALASEAGAEVIVSDPDASRRAFARRLGAATSDPAARPGSLEHLDVALGTAASPEVLVAIEASGAAAAARTAIDVIGVGGVVVLAGGDRRGGDRRDRPELPIDPEALASRLVTVTGVRGATADQLTRAAAFLERSWRVLPLDELVGATHPLAELDAALEEAGTGLHVRVGVAPGRRTA
ncbi:alcohol dehydrogenase catalytic domain-containing protein [Agromyces ramosus]|uniref:Phosphonate catabolism associated alcohol dehydrogenase n=1 Tax=Agromyces ramosus TaxID=33879 RepID=A0ABU0R967_9MICO|nr:alcohol dehydrogenase catalytic domain-containing protein [Agromyces ramosus]MDQ0893756.1 putative phosphonate catabolism associated alcohol dehydrogenase [Agromyces ramosus]